MPSQVRVSGNTKGLDEILKNVSTKLSARVGIFASDNARDDGMTNAVIGAKHEFGSLSEGLPRRSFLKDPITMKRKELLDTAKKVIKANISEEGGAKKIFELIGIAGEAIVQEAFESGGFGTWQPISQMTANAKGSSQILIDSSQLRKAVTSTVKNGNT